MGSRFRQDGSQSVRLTALVRAGRRILADAGDAFLEPLCPSCGIPVAPGRLFHFCAECSAAVLPCGPVFCPVCGSPAKDCCVCGLAGPASFDSARSAFIWAGPVKDIVLTLKYSRRWDLARPMGMVMAAAWRASDHPPCEFVTGVPVSGRRYLSRGYNQAFLLASEFALASGMKARNGVLSRIEGNGSTRGASRAERLGNTSGRVVPERGLRIDGADVILVDDVLTTGATAAACAAALKDAGAARVHVVTFARAVGGL